MVGIFKKVAFISMLWLSALCVYAEDNKAAVVDLQLVLEKASVIKSISTQSEKLESDAQQKYTLAEEKFNKDKEALLKSKETMSEEAYDKKMDELSQNLMKAQNELQYQGSIISAARYTALSNVQNKIIEIVTNIAEKQKLGIVMSKGVALYSKKEVSQETIDELNKSMPDIKVDIESAKKKITNKQNGNGQQ